MPLEHRIPTDEDVPDAGFAWSRPRIAPPSPAPARSARRRSTASEHHPRPPHRRPLYILALSPPGCLDVTRRRNSRRVPGSIMTVDEMTAEAWPAAVTSPGPPTTVSLTTSTPPAHSARRPSRKSTLTQQQKNQKRQRATQDQLVTLEVEFNKNPTPTAAVRERIAQDINMTERSVQIWFQNRYVGDVRPGARSLSWEETNIFPLPFQDEPRSSSWPRGASRRARTVMPFPTRCDSI